MVHGGQGWGMGSQDWWHGVWSLRVVCMVAQHGMGQSLINMPANSVSSRYLYDATTKVIIIGSLLQHFQVFLRPQVCHFA